MSRARRTTGGAERREHARYDLSVEVDYSHGDTFLFSYIENISEMGIFIRTEDPLALGTEIELAFTPPGGERLRLRGEVVWINPVKPGGENLNPGMGVRFVDLGPEDRERVVDLVRTIAYLQSDAN